MPKLMPRLMPRLMIATPCFGGSVTTLYAQSLLRLQQDCAARGVAFTVSMLGGDALITRARASLVAHFLDDPAATHLLFIDADIGFEPAQVWRLMDFGADICAAVYPTKRLDWTRIAQVLAAGTPNPQSAALSYVLEPAEDAPADIRDGFVRVRYAGTGFLMLSRTALLRLCDAHPELQYRRQHERDDPLRDSPHRYALFDCMIDPTEQLYLSEDFSFCRRWTDLGGEIWADLTSRLSHTGPITFAGDFAAQFKVRDQTESSLSP